MNDRLDHDAANQILRRAAEIEMAGQTSGPGMDRAALEAAADEVGLSPAAVRRAMAEHDVGALETAPERRSLLGPARARVVQTVDLPVSLAHQAVTRWLKSQLLVIHSRSGGELVWTRRQDMAAKLRRRVDPTKRVRLGAVDRVVVSVVDGGDGRAIVRLDADLEFTRKGLLTGVVAIPAALGPVLGGAAALVTGEPLVFLAGFPTGVALGGAGLYAGRRTLSSERDDAQRVLELFVAELDRGT